MLTDKGSRLYFIVFGTFFAGFSTVAVITGLVGNTHPMIFVVGPVLIGAGLFIVWIGMEWISDGADGRVGGGPIMTVMLAPGESIVRAVPAAYHEMAGPFPSLGAAFENDSGRLYVSDRRLIYCPSRFRFDRHPASIPFGEMGDVREGTSERSMFTIFGNFGMTIETKSGVVALVWLKDQTVPRDFRAALAANESAVAPAAYLIQISTGTFLFGVGFFVLCEITVSLLIAFVETPWPIVAFFLFGSLVGAIGTGRMVLKYVRQPRRPSWNALS